MKGKFSDVHFMEADLHPVAECHECTWDTKFIGGSPKIAAKQHVAATGHRVVVTKKTVSEYWLPEKKAE
jgi:hypothetical protein